MRHSTRQLTWIFQKVDVMGERWERTRGVPGFTERPVAEVRWRRRGQGGLGRWAGPQLVVLQRPQWVGEKPPKAANSLPIFFCKQGCSSSRNQVSLPCPLEVSPKKCLWKKAINLNYEAKSVSISFMLLLTWECFPRLYRMGFLVIFTFVLECLGGSKASTTLWSDH